MIIIKKWNLTHMLQKKNKGSILIISIIIFSIISSMCITCSALILSSNRINNLEYKTEQLKEENLGIIEIIYSNMLKEIKYATENTHTEDEFYKYITKSNSNIFMNKVKNIENKDAISRTVQMAFNESLSTKEFIHYKISTKSKINNYDKYALISVKIKNPWVKEKDKDLEDKKMDKIEENDLITFYNYEEK